MAEGERDGLKEELMEVRDGSHKSGEPLECQTHPLVEADASSSFVGLSSSASRVNILEKEVEELRYSSYKPREPLERRKHSGLSVAEAGPSSSIAEPSSPPSNPGEVHGVDPPHHHNSQWNHTKAASQASPDADDATSEHLRDSRVHEANLPGGTLQRQEQTEEIHRRLDDEAAARQKAEAEVDRLEKELRELRDIIGLTSPGQLERQAHLGRQVPLHRMLVYPLPHPDPPLPLAILNKVHPTSRDFTRTTSHVNEPECPESARDPPWHLFQIEIRGHFASPHTRP
ncbi:hypothetical protein BU15DRAFT_65330 [Melanogaster broomeanus]|nr:hypothetical protein BU15DRAFT_65330 [Melanogaster broomeanus]